MKAGVLALTGRLKLLTPTLIGCGESENTDIDVIKDSEGKPFIPATSLVGVLRSTIKPEGVELYKFWGYTNDKETSCSALRCDDLKVITQNVNLEIRDGIKINHKTGLVAEGAKYDYEIIPAGTEFQLNIEVSYHNDDKALYLQMLKTIEHYLSSEYISVGAKTNSGLGRIRLVGAKIYDFAFSKKPAVYYWLTLNYNDSLIANDIAPLKIKSKDFTINATFKLKTSLLTRSYSDEPDAPDTVHIKSGNDHVITGTSLKGAIRARAMRISNTIHNSDKLIEELFGYAYDDEDEAQSKGKKKGDALKGRLKVEEVILPKFISELQTRIKIDRFTGGTIEGALLESMPLFSLKNDAEIKNLKITIRDYRPHEAGLMLLVLKDLWTGDVAIGGEKSIGRGVLEGIRAEIIFDGKTITIDKDINSLKEDDLDALEKLVTNFSNLVMSNAS